LQRAEALCCIRAQPVAYIAGRRRYVSTEFLLKSDRLFYFREELIKLITLTLWRSPMRTALTLPMSDEKLQQELINAFGDAPQKVTIIDWVTELGYSK